MLRELGGEYCGIYMCKHSNSLSACPQILKCNKKKRKVTARRRLVVAVIYDPSNPNSTRKIDHKYTINLSAQKHIYIRRISPSSNRRPPRLQIYMYIPEKRTERALYSFSPLSFNHRSNTHL